MIGIGMLVLARLFAGKLITGGGSCEDKNYLSMYRVQAEKLQYYKGQENYAR